MGRIRGVVSASLVAVAAAQLVYNPVGHAQEPPPGEPEVQAQGSNVAPAPPGAPPGDAAPPPAGPVVTLRADSSKARLQIMGQQLQWRDVCVTPCNVPVNPAGAYRVGGGTIRPSVTFNMPRPSGRVVVDAQTGSNVKHWVGIALIAGGVLDAGFGAIYYADAEDLAKTNTSGLSKASYQGVGIASIVTGVILLAIGIPLALSSTSVEIR